LAQVPNDDVNRAMAAFAASEIPYRTFASPVTPPAQAQHESNDATPGEALAAASSRTDAFPLLTAALPEVTQFPMPHPFVPRTTVLAEPPTPPSSRESEPSPKPETRSPAPKQIDILAVRSSAAFNVPASKTPVANKLKLHITAPNASADRTTSLAAVFQTLQVTTPVRPDRTGPHSPLQNILKRL
jgi:hypothetical protein